MSTGSKDLQRSRYYNMLAKQLLTLESSKYGTLNGTSTAFHYKAMRASEETSFVSWGEGG